MSAPFKITSSSLSPLVQCFTGENEKFNFSGCKVAIVCWWMLLTVGLNCDTFDAHCYFLCWLTAIVCDAGITMSKSFFFNSSCFDLCVFWILVLNSHLEMSVQTSAKSGWAVVSLAQNCRLGVQTDHSTNCLCFVTLLRNIKHFYVCVCGWKKWVCMNLNSMKGNILLMCFVDLSVLHQCNSRIICEWRRVFLIVKCELWNIFICFGKIAHSYSAEDFVT
jgi:hypothetical protein